MAAAIPPISNQTALLVGEPVKNFDTSELNDSMALTPQMRSTIPTANSATEMPLFIGSVVLELIAAKPRTSAMPPDTQGRERRRSRISVSNRSSADGGGGSAAGSGAGLRFRELMPLTSMKMQKATMVKSIIVLINEP